MALDPMHSDRQCTAHSKQTGERCRRLASPGSAVCVMHGSRSPQARRRAAERIAEADACALLAGYEVEPVTNPIRALSELAGEVMTWKALLADRLAELQASEWRYTGRPGEQLHAHVALFERALDRAGRLLTDMAKLDLDARMVRLNERQAAMMADVLEVALAELNLTREQGDLARDAMVRELRAIDGGS